MRVSTLCSLLFFALAACAPRAMPAAAEHPANPDAPVGRLAGPPAALRPGVAQLTDPSAPPPEAVEGHEHHGHGAPAAEPAKPEPKQKSEPKQKKPEPKQKAPDPHEGHR